MTPSRRSLLTGIGALLFAPAIVRASSLMPVKAWAIGDETPELLIKCTERILPMQYDSSIKWVIAENVSDPGNDIGIRTLFFGDKVPAGWIARTVSFTLDASGAAEVNWPPI